MRVRILKTDDRLRIKEGEIYSAKRYWLDPHDKITLLEREPDGFDPECNQYKEEVAYWMDNQWMILQGNQFIPEKV